MADSNSDDAAPIGFKGTALKGKGIKVSTTTKFGSAAAPISRPKVVVASAAPSRNESLMPVVPRKATSVRFAPSKPAVSSASARAVAGAGAGAAAPGLSAVTEEPVATALAAAGADAAAVIEIGEVDVASADEIAAAAAEVAAIKQTLGGKNRKFASNPPPADAPMMAEGELTEELQDRVEGENPVRSTPLTLASGDIVPENEYTIDVKRESGKPVGIGEYRPISSARFSDFIIETYGQFSPYLQRVLKEGEAAAAVPKELDRDACKKRDPNKVETFYYQNFVRDYLSRGSPYRGLLVYHGLGTGKTCTSIAAAEALYWGGQKTIFVMTPATLSNNYRKDLGKCGYFPLRRNNFWAFLKAGSAEDPAYVWLTEALGLPPATVTAQGGGWVANPDRPSNWETLSPEVVGSIRSQQMAHLNHRFKFIHYNGVTPTVLAQLAASGVAEGKSMFDDAVVVIDEIHNLVRTINGSLIGGKPISQIIETVEPREYTWSTPIGRDRPGFRYPRGYTLYRLLQNAVGAKIVALSATPMINYAQELAVLMNLIGGEQRVVEISLKTMGRDPATMKRLEEWATMRPDIDYFTIEESADRSTILTVTPVPFGFVKVVRTLRYDAALKEATKRKTTLSAAETAALKFEDFENRGFVRVPPEQAGTVKESRERNMDMWAVTLLKDLEEKGLLRGGGVEAEAAVAAARAKGPGSLPATTLFKLHTYPMLPEDATQFVSNFVNRASLEIMNTNVLKARASGLISYYKGGSEELMPRKGVHEQVRVPMSEYMFKEYSVARLAELDMEAPPEKEEEEGGKKKKRKGMTAAEVDMYAQATKSQQTGFLALSRAACNWVFPEDVPRPKVSVKDQVKLLGAEQNKQVDADLDENQDAEMDAGPPPAAGAGAAGADAEGAGDAEVAGAAVLPDAPQPQAPNPLDATLSGIIGTLMSGLEGTPEKADAYLNVGLPTFSPKYATMVAKIRESAGPALVYSQFKTLEGLGIFAAALRAAPEKYLPLDIQKVGGEWIIPESLLTAESKARPRYILYTGDQELDKRRLLLQLYNADLSSLPPRLAAQCADLLAGAPDNRDGRVCRVFMITQSGAEGISLFNTRQVHIMEPYWNNVRLQQVIGRAIRLCSHQDLPWDDRVVDIFTYLSVFSAKQKAEGSKTLMMADKSMTTDEIIFDIATKKQKLADGLFEIAQTSAVDCEIHFHEHGKVTQCFKYEEGSHPLFMFHPDWRKDLKAPVRPVKTAPK